MGTRRQPSQRFLSRLKGKSEPLKKRHSLIRWYRESDWWLWTEVFVVLVGFWSIALTAWMIRIDLDDRQTQRVVQAWQLVTQNAPGNSGKGPALEYLNSQGIPLVGIDLSEESNQGPSFLVRVDLSGALLANANLSRAELWQADLSGAALRGADLSRAMLNEADLSGARLEDVDLSGAWLWQADLSGANLKNADLSRALLSEAKFANADLSGALLGGAKNLYQKTLDGACGDDKTHLPRGLTIKRCPEIASGVPPAKP